MASLPSNTSVSEGTQSLEYFRRGQRNLADNSIGQGDELNAGPQSAVSFPYLWFVNSLSSLGIILN